MYTAEATCSWCRWETVPQMYPTSAKLLSPKLFYVCAANTRSANNVGMRIFGNPH